MKKEIIASVLVLALAHSPQVLAAVVPQASMWDQAKQSLNSYRDNVTSLLSIALIADYTNLAKKAELLIGSALSEATAKIAVEDIEYIAKYNSIKRSVEDSGIDVSVCASDFEDALTTTKQKNIAAVDACVNLIEPTLDYVSGATKNLVERYLDTVYLYDKQILTCGPSDDDCLSNVVYTLVQAAARVQGLIANDIARDVGQFGPYESQIAACSQKYTSINEQTRKDIIEVFQRCVANL